MAFSITDVWPFQNDATLPNGNHKQNPRVVITVFIAREYNATMQDGDPHYGSSNAVILGRPAISC